MPPELLPASFGGVTFRVAFLSGQGGRDIVVKSPSRGDAHLLQDRGLRIRTTRCDVFFVDEQGSPPALERFREFQGLANDGAPRIFTHPIDGSYRARITDFEYQTGADDREISVSCTFLQDGEAQTVYRPGLGVAPLAGVDEVSATVAAAEEQLADEGLASEVPRSTLDTVVAWTEAETVDSRAVYLETASLSQEIGDEIDRLELVSNLDRWPIYREFIHLQSQLRRAAEAATSEAEDVYEVAVTTSMPVRLLCAQIYGAAEADDKARQVTTLNRLRTPGRIPAGTVLKVPREGAR